MGINEMTTNRIDQRFKQLRDAGRCGLIPFITAGDPFPEATVPLMHSLVAGGADLLELGVPFSDPMADGPVIQASSERAIERGISLVKVLEAVADFRHVDQDTPVILMGYMNPVERLGSAELATTAQSSGVDALLLVDCPPEEAPGLQRDLSNRNIYQIYLVAPTTTQERCEKICGYARGFVYYVAVKGITGTQQSAGAQTADNIAVIRKFTDLPVAMGFGIKDARSAALAAREADAVVIGSALVEELVNCDSVDSACRTAEVFVARMRSAIDNKDKAIAR